MRSLRIVIRASQRHKSFLLAPFSSLHSPMFPERAKPDIPDTPSDPDSILSNHGGKIALVGFSFAAGLIYRWYMGGRTKIILEEEISQEAPVDPYEINELRAKNAVSREKLVPFIDEILKHYHGSSITYNQFISFYWQYFGNDSSVKIENGYMLDRLVLFYVNKYKSLSNIPENLTVESSNGSSNLDLNKNIKLPIPFYLVMLTLTISKSTEETQNSLKYKDVFDVLFHIAQYCDTSSYTSSNDSNVEGKHDNDGKRSEETSVDVKTYVTENQVKVIIQNLIDSWQVI